MPLNSDEQNVLNYVIGSEETVRGMATLRPLPPFSEEAVAFLADLSKMLLRTGKKYSDVVTFGFWCRRSALLREKSRYGDLSRRLGKGVVFHSTPSNVPVNFAFSFAAGLLAGNANIVRLPAKDFAQAEIICGAAGELLAGAHKNAAPYVCMVKYPSSQAITDFFSSLCDSRVVWGGDATIEKIRRSPLKPRAGEITFADRYSIAVIDAGEYLKAPDKARIAADFYNDTYYSDQNACTSPRIVAWTGTGKAAAKEDFWGRVHALAKENYALSPVQCVGKLAAFYKAAARRDIKLIKSEDQFVTRAAVKQADGELMEDRYNSGYFFEYDADGLRDLLPLCTERCQTLVYYGIERDVIARFLQECRPRGVDRAVPFGRSMDFSLVWDGVDLIRSLSREFSV